MLKKSIGIYPWAEALEKEGDKHQVLFKNALERNNYSVHKIKYKKGFPLRHALKEKVDILILDWVHSFYTSQSFVKTMIKAFLGYFDLYFFNKKQTTVIWNLHNLQRHDGKFKKIEKFCFRQLAKKVDFIRIFNVSQKDKVRQYLKITDRKIVSIEQGPYLFKKNSLVNLYARYKISNNVKILLCFGSIRKGKGLPKLIQSFIKANKKEWVLLITGKANNIELLDDIVTLTKSRANIIFDNKYIPDTEVKSYFDCAEYVVLPYEKTLNSGVLLLARTFDTPIMANFNFKELAQDNDLIGDLFKAEQFSNLLENSNIRKRGNIRNSKHSWDVVVSEFEKLF